MDKNGDRLVIVCDACLRASCWAGMFMCSRARNAGTTEKTVRELRQLNLEHPDNWEDTPADEYHMQGDRENGRDN
jgi:hypothetical protein